MTRSWGLVLSLVGLFACPLAARAQPSVPPVPTIAELVARIDLEPDPLHNDFTPAVWALCERGLDGAAAVLPLLEAPQRDTRMHASRALSCAVSRSLGWRPGRGYDPGSGGEARFLAIWNANGAYEWDADPAARHASRARWERWIAAQRSAPVH